jgi:hypothetical protein
MDRTSTEVLSGCDKRHGYLGIGRVPGGVFHPNGGGGRHSTMATEQSVEGRAYYGEAEKYISIKGMSTLLKNMTVGERLEVNMSAHTNKIIITPQGTVLELNKTTNTVVFHYSLLKSGVVHESLHFLHM